MELLKRLWREEEGQGMAEYGLILGLIAVAVIVAVTTLGGGLNQIFGRINSELGDIDGVSIDS